MVWQLSLPRPATSPVPTTQTSGAVTAVLFSAPHLMTVTLTTIASHFPRKWCFQVLLPRNRACIKHASLILNSFNNWVFFPLKRQTLNLTPLLKIYSFRNYSFLVFVWHASISFSSFQIKLCLFLENYTMICNRLRTCDTTVMLLLTHLHAQ